MKKMKFPNDWILTTQEGFLELLLKKVDIFLSYTTFHSSLPFQHLGQSIFSIEFAVSAFRPIKFLCITFSNHAVFGSS